MSRKPTIPSSVLSNATRIVVSLSLGNLAVLGLDSMEKQSKDDIVPPCLSLSCELDPILLHAIANWAFLRCELPTVEEKFRKRIRVRSESPFLSLVLPDLMSDAEFDAWQRRSLITRSTRLPKTFQHDGKFQFNIGYKY